MAEQKNREMALSVLAAGREAPEEEGALAVQLAQVYAILDLADAVRELRDDRRVGELIKHCGHVWKSQGRDEWAEGYEHFACDICGATSRKLMP